MYVYFVFISLATAPFHSKIYPSRLLCFIYSVIARIDAMITYICSHWCIYLHVIIIIHTKTICNLTTMPSKHTLDDSVRGSIFLFDGPTFITLCLTCSISHRQNCIFENMNRDTKTIQKQQGAERCQVRATMSCLKPCAHERIGRVAPTHDAFLRPIYSCAGDLDR